MNASTVVRRRALARRGALARILAGGGRSPAGSGRSRRRTIALAAAIALVILGGGYLWFRDSSLVAVRKVTITGLTGKDASKIRRALTAAARTMTTLDVDTAALHTAVAPYTEVRGIHVTTQFPHGLLIDVLEDDPLAMISAGGQEVAVAPDGRLLHDASTSAPLPVIAVAVAPGGARVSSRGALDALAVLAAAPYQFIARISQAGENGTHGVVIQLRAGPAVYFGAPRLLGAKWQALVAVLADPGSAGASYIDVSDPQRPAAGGGSAAAEAAIAAGLAQTGASTAATGSGGASTAATGSGGASTAATGSGGASTSGAATAGSSGAATTPASGANGTATTPASGGLSGSSTAITPTSAGTATGAGASPTPTAASPTAAGAAAPSPASSGTSTSGGGAL